MVETTATATCPKCGSAMSEEVNPQTTTFFHNCQCGHWTQTQVLCATDQIVCDPDGARYVADVSGLSAEEGKARIEELMCEDYANALGRTIRVKRLDVYFGDDEDPTQVELNPAVLCQISETSRGEQALWVGGEDGLPCFAHWNVTAMEDRAELEGIREAWVFAPERHIDGRITHPTLHDDPSQREWDWVTRPEAI